MTLCINSLYAFLAIAGAFKEASAFAWSQKESSTANVIFRRTKGPSAISSVPFVSHPLEQASVQLYSNLFQSTQKPFSPRYSHDTPLLNNRHSAADWLYNVRSIPQSGVLRAVRNPVLAVFGWSLAVAVIHDFCGHVGWHTLARRMCIPATAHSFLVSALGLLLVFRTNSAYQRFYEGRKIWEHILSVSRNLSRMVHLYGKEIGKERKRRIINLVAAYPYLLRHHIRPGCLCEESSSDIPEKHRLLLHDPSIVAVQTRHEGDKTCGGTTRADLAVISKPRECWVDKRNLPWCLFEKSSLSKIARAQNRPIWACDRIAREMMSIPYGPNFTSRERLSLLGQVEKLTNAVGQCERIHQTAVPLNYARHSLRSLTIWLFTLPFALVKDFGVLAAPVNAIVAWLLFGVYEIGYSIEDPFQGSLRLSILCDAIRRDVLGEKEIHRETAFDLGDIWADDDEDEVAEESEASAPRANVPSHNPSPVARRHSTTELADSYGIVPPSPFVPQSNGHQLFSGEGFLGAPQLIKENGTWNVVGIVEG